MKIVMSGGERSSYASVLVKTGVHRIALNLTQFRPPKNKELDLTTKFNGAEVYLYTSEDDADVARFDTFIREQESCITAIIGRPDYDGTWLGEKYYPLWNDGKDMERLAFLMEKHGRVAISDKAITTKNRSRIRQLQQRWGAKLLGLTSKTDNIESLPWDTVIVSSWTSVVRYGETQVWDGHALRRYPAQQKESARKKHRADIIRLGCDFDEVMEDSVDEVSKLAILSWLQWESRTFGPSDAYDPVDDPDDDEMEVSEGGQVATTCPPTPDRQNGDSGGFDLATTPLNTRHQSERRIIPVLGIETMIHTGSDSDLDELSQGKVAFEPIPMMRTVKYTLRQCDTCYLSANCPEFKPRSDCAYELPIELRTKEQRDAVMRFLLEVQMGRITFGVMAEQLEGQGADPALSKEIDRMGNMLLQYKEIQDTRDMIEFSVKAKAGAGAISRIFGPAVSEQQQVLHNPMPARELDAVLGPILDAQVINELTGEYQEQ